MAEIQAAIANDRMSPVLGGALGDQERTNYVERIGRGIDKGERTFLLLVAI